MQINRSQLLIRISLVLGILILINVLSVEYHYRLDFTADQRYTLSNATEQILKQVEKPVTVNAYFSKDLPARQKKAKRHFEDLLTEYRNHTEEDFVYKFINPNKDQESEKKARRKGIQPFVLGTQKRDQVQRQRAYMGAVIQIGEQSEVISRLQPQGPAEYKLSSNIHKLTQTDKPSIAVFTGFNGISKSDLGQALDDLGVIYNLEEHRLKPGEPIPDKYRTGIIANPADSFPPGVFNQLDQFLSAGKNLVVATDIIDDQLQQQRLKRDDSKLVGWLKEKGFDVSDQVLIDADCGAVTVRRQMQGRGFRQQVRFPYFPIIKNFSDHPVGKGVGQVFLPFCNPIDTTKSKNLDYAILAQSSKKSGLQNLPATINVQKQWQENDFRESHLPVAVGAEGQFGNAQGQSRLVVVGSDNLIPKNENNQPRGRSRPQVREGNANFFVNAVDWVSDQMGLMALRTQGVTARPIEDVSDDNKVWIKYGNAFAPIILILIIGLVRYQIQLRKRKKWQA